MTLKDLVGRGAARYRTGIAPLDQEVPNGFPLNAFGVVRGPGGGGKSVIINEMAMRLMDAGKRVVYICLEDTPLAVLENMISLGWDPSKAESDLIHLVDCFSNQVLKRDTAYENSTLVRNPTEPEEITAAIRDVVSHGNSSKVGAIFADSLTELFFQSHPFKAVNALKAWRAIFCKENYIPFWATYHTGLQQFAAYDDMITYSSDVIIDTRHEPAFVRAGALVKQFRVTKLKGATHNTAWVTFDVGTAGIQRMTLDDIKQIARSITRYESPESD